jgi:hypothetical protein
VCLCFLAMARSPQSAAAILTSRSDSAKGAPITAAVKSPVSPTSSRLSRAISTAACRPTTRSRTRRRPAPSSRLVPSLPAAGGAYAAGTHSCRPAGAPAVAQETIRRRGAQSRSRRRLSPRQPPSRAALAEAYESHGGSVRTIRRSGQVMLPWPPSLDASGAAASSRSRPACGRRRSARSWCSTACGCACRNCAVSRRP